MSLRTLTSHGQPLFAARFLKTFASVCAHSVGERAGSALNSVYAQDVINLNAPASNPAPWTTQTETQAWNTCTQREN